jgi:eukaryotic-like serine/threonine-protein kinase
MVRRSAEDNMQQSSLVGSTVGSFKVEEKLGSGGMGVVYKALDLKLHRHVALKFLPEILSHDADALERFRREARAASTINHPGICTIYDICEHEEKPFIVMELLEGSTLAQRIGGRPLPAEQALSFGADIADALAVAHARGIIHRDIKPANIFVTRDGRAKILDFGLAKLHPQMSAGAGAFSTLDDLTVPGVPLGTFAYMSPEQVRGEDLDARSDLFSFGVVLYEMVTGVLPFRGESMGVIAAAILNSTPVAPVRMNPDIPPKLEAIIDKALEKDRKLRYQNAADLRTDIERLKRDSDAGHRGSATAQVGPKSAPQSTRFRWIAIISAMILVGLGLVGWLFFSRKAHALTDKDTIVLADFTNTTGDAVFDDSLRRGLSVQLEQSPFLSIISDQQVQQTLRMMGQKPDAKLTPEIARELCQRTGSAAVLDGSIAQVGTPYLITIRALNCATGKTLASTEAQASDKSQVLEVLGKTTSDIRNKLGESLKTVEKFDTPLEQATTSSLEALKAFSSGYHIHTSAGDAAAIPFYKQAIELDPNFALAYEWMGLSFNGLGQPSTDAYYTRRAYELRERTSGPEKYFISARYQKQVTGNVEKAEQACRLWIQAYPRDALPHIYLSGAILPVTGQYEKAVEEGKEAVRLNPDSSPAYYVPIFNYIALNRLDEAKATYGQALERKMSHPYFHYAMYQIAFLRNDRAAMADEVKWAVGQPGAEDILLALEADTAAYSGRLKEARKFSAQAVDSTEREARKEADAMYSVRSGLREALFGNGDQARRQATLAMELSNGRDVVYGAALTFLNAGDDGRAQALVGELSKRFPEDTIVQFNYLPTLRAKLAVSRGNAAAAVESLRAAAPYELGASTFSTPRWNGLYPVFVRGEAYLGAHQGNEAAAEFQKILDHPGMVVNEPIGALARLGLARAYVLEGDTIKARASYQDFLTLWKDADPDIPILKQAQAEYAKLK